MLNYILGVFCGGLLVGFLAYAFVVWGLGYVITGDKNWLGLSLPKKGDEE